MIRLIRAHESRPPFANMLKLNDMSKIPKKWKIISPKAFMTIVIMTVMITQISADEEGKLGHSCQPL